MSIDPTSRIGEDVLTRSLQMVRVLDQSVVVGPMPEPSVIRGPVAPTHTRRPGPIYTCLEVPDDVGNGLYGLNVWVCAEDNNRVDVVRHDNVSIEGNACLI